MPAALMVTYPATPGARFDRDYYVATHLPLVEEKWAAHGLETAAGYFPEEDAAVLAVAVLTFRDAAAREAALGSAEASAVFGDIPNFTDAQPTPLALSVA